MDEFPVKESLARFPALARARSLYIALFKDDSPLIKLGYTGGQRKVTKPVLYLMQEAGKIVNPDTPHPELWFQDKSDTQRVHISELDNSTGFNLIATNETKFSGLAGIRHIMSSDTLRGPVFEDNLAVAEINLIPQNTIENNLQQLLKAIYEGGYAFPQLRSEGMLSRVTRALGQTTTFRAQWTDDTQLEFVVELKPPGLETDEVYYHHWRKLNSISDFQGVVVPIGRKPNSSKEQILQMLNNQPEKAVQGQLALQPRSLVTNK